jgi:thiamine pyrophosphokinase
MLNLNTCFNNFKSILCLNGQIPARDFFINKNLPIIATDGAGSQLLSMNIIPQIIVGDFDSFDYNKLPKTADIELVQIPEQNTTDCQKALNLIHSRKLFPCLIYGATGRETDHTLYNLNIIAEYSHKHTIIFHDSAYTYKQKYGIFLNDHLVGDLPIGNKFSILTFSTAIVSSHGLEWELENMSLTNTNSSIRNLVKEKKIEIFVHSGQALVLFDTKHTTTP